MNIYDFVKENIILFALLLTTICLICGMYKTQFTGKTFIITICLYIIVSLLAVSFIGKYMAQNNIEFDGWRFILGYFVLAFGGIMIMNNDNLYMSHVGFLLLLLSMSLIVGNSIKHSSNIFNAALITSLIIFVLTAIVFTSSEDGLVKMAGWVHNLVWILLGIILIEIGFIIYGGNETVHEIITMAGIGLFSFFILSDTSKLLLEAKNSECKFHLCVNYPKKTSRLLLDYLNLFVNFLHYK